MWWHVRMEIKHFVKNGIFRSVSIRHKHITIPGLHNVHIERKATVRTWIVVVLLGKAFIDKVYVFYL